MNIDTLEVYEVIDHDKENQSEKLPLEDSEVSPGAFQLDLFESMSCQKHPRGDCKELYQRRQTMMKQFKFI
ncbi:hypothetical protein HGP05_00680 [Streptococcus sanguinis]|uniref:Uncharacterized protein n=1 Tax=Streptococcus sanguinis TaxID=1305 RepID=A0A7Y0VB21_STRSA|nr:hypothetical protein [Streptococcus sanguinis]